MLTYLMLTSLDGYTADEDGEFGWAAPDDEVHRYVNELSRPVGTYLYGRRMYETMVFWETAHEAPGAPDHIVEFARIWQAAEKVVYSTTLPAVSTARTRLERTFDADQVRKLAADQDVAVGGPALAAEAMRAGLVDEYHQFLAPVIVGGGTPMYPAGVGVALDLVGERRFDSGFVHLHHRRADR